jgi:hypothetical protein
MLSESPSVAFAFALALSNLVTTTKMRSDYTLVPDWCFSRASSIFETASFPFLSKSSLFKMRTEEDRCRGPAYVAEIFGPSALKGAISEKDVGFLTGQEP